MFTILALTLAIAGGSVEKFRLDHPGSQRIASPDGHMLVHASGFSLDLGARTPEAAARAFLDRYGTAFGLDPRQALVTASGPSGQISAVHFLRTLDGLPLFGGDLVVGVDAHDRVFLVNSGPVAPVTQGRHAISASAAERAALASFAGPVRAGPAVIAAGWRSFGSVIRPVFRVDLIASQPAGDFRTYIDAETGRALFREDLRFRATAPGTVFEVSPVETKASACPLSNGAHTKCASPVAVTLPNLATGSDLSGTQTSVFNCKGADQPASKAGVPGTCTAVTAVGSAFNFAVDTTFVSLSDDFAASMAYYHLDKHVSFFKALDAALPPAGNSSNGQSRSLRGSLPALVNVRDKGAAFDNAFFSGGLDAMVFGQGTAADYAYDATVMYHEFTHGVVFAWGGMSPDFDSQGGYDEGAAVNEGTADSMAASETGRSEIGGFVGATSNPPQAALRDMADPNAKRTCHGDGSLVTQFGAQTINGLDGEVHDDGEIWNGFFWEIFQGLRAAGLKSCSSGCEAGAAIQYKALQLSAGTAPSFLSYSQSMKAAATALFPSLPAVANYVGCISQRRGFDKCDRTVPVYAGETKLQHVRLKFSPFQIQIPITTVGAGFSVCSFNGTSTTVHIRKDAPVQIASLDPNTLVATFIEDDSGTFTQACSAGSIAFGPATAGNWYLLFESANALVGQNPGFDIYQVQPDSTGVAARPAATAPATCTISIPLTLNSGPASTPPKGTLQLSAAGGAGGNVWSLTTNASGGSINASTGAYTAGATGSVTDIVQVKDSAATTLTRNISVTAGVSMTPATATLDPKGKQAFSAAGGSGTGFTWSITINNSGGTIDATGAYTAGDKGGIKDTVQVSDSLGNTATALVSVNGSGGGCASGAAAGPAALLLLLWGVLLHRRRRGSANARPEGR